MATTACCAAGMSSREQVLDVLPAEMMLCFHWKFDIMKSVLAESPFVCWRALLLFLPPQKKFFPPSADAFFFRLCFGAFTQMHAKVSDSEADVVLKRVAHFLPACCFLFMLYILPTRHRSTCW